MAVDGLRGILRLTVDDIEAGRDLERSASAIRSRSIWQRIQQPVYDCTKIYEFNIRNDYVTY